MTNNEFYTIIKVCKGGLVLDIPDYKGQYANKMIKFTYREEKKMVNRNYALGILADPVLSDMFKAGKYFTIDPLKDFLADAKELMLDTGAAPEKVNYKEIDSALRNNNQAKIKNYLKDPKYPEIIIERAEAMFDNLSTGMINFLNKELNISLGKEEEQE
jgi:hypothetical protein